MTVLTIPQTLSYAQQAGFQGASLQTMVAIAMCESNLHTDWINTAGNTPIGSRDRGIIQINDYWHSEVSDMCAFNPICSFQQGYRISSNGTSFSQWATFNSGCYLQYMTQVQTAMSQMGTTGTTQFSFPNSVGMTDFGLPQGFLDWLTNPMRPVKLISGIVLLLLALLLALSDKGTQIGMSLMKQGGITPSQVLKSGNL